MHQNLEMVRKGKPEQTPHFEENIFNLMGNVVSKFVSEDICISKVINLKGETQFWTNSVDIFEKALLSLWVQKYFPPSSKEKVLEVMELLQSEMEQVLVENTWLDEKTKQNAIEVLKAVNYKILGYHDEILEEDKMKKYHERFLVEEMNPNSFVENQVQGSLMSKLYTQHANISRDLFFFCFKKLALFPFSYLCRPSCEERSVGPMEPRLWRQKTTQTMKFVDGRQKLMRSR